MSKLELKDYTEDMLPKGKPWYKSKTIWVNLTTVIAGTISLLPGLAGVIPATTLSILLFSLGLLNVVLRVITDEGIE